MPAGLRLPSDAAVVLWTGRLEHCKLTMAPHSGPGSRCSGLPGRSWVLLMYARPCANDSDSTHRSCCRRERKVRLLNGHNLSLGAVIELPAMPFSAVDCLQTWSAR